MGKKMLFIDLKGCTRCGKRHKNLEIHRFKRPCLVWDFWATCPKTKEPILILYTYNPDRIEEMLVDNG